MQHTLYLLKIPMNNNWKKPGHITFSNHLKVFRSPFDTGSPTAMPHQDLLYDMICKICPHGQVEGKNVLWGPTNRVTVLVTLSCHHYCPLCMKLIFCKCAH